jgi:hypothetical protein
VTPFDAEVALRAWGVLDERVRDLLMEENDGGGATGNPRRRPKRLQGLRRARAVAERARRAGWPTSASTIVEQRAATQRALRRLGVWAEWREARRSPLTGRSDDTDRAASIFDE